MDDPTDGIAETLLSEMPEPQEHVIEAERATDNAPQSEPIQADNRGDTFDPAIHVTDADGNPVLTKAGNYRKRPGRKAGSVPTSSIYSEPPPTQAEPALPDPAARAAADTLFTLGVTLGGEEWLPIQSPETGLDERAEMIGAFDAYFKAAGIVDIPPGLALSIAVGGYALPRFTQPKTRTRMQRAKDRVAAWWLKRKARKNARSDSGNDGKRENDARETSSE